MREKIKTLYGYMEGNRLFYVGAIICVVISTSISMISPLILKFTVDSVIGDEPYEALNIVNTIIDYFGGVEGLRQKLWLCALALLVINIFNGLFQFLKGKWTAQASESIAANLRNRLYSHMQNLTYDYHVKAETGDLIQRCTSDIETIRRFLAVQLVEIGRSALILIVSLAVMLRLDKIMTLASVMGVPIIFGFSYVFFMKVQKAFLKADEAEGRLSNTLQENLTGIRVVRAFGRQRFELDKFDERNKEYKNLNKKLIDLLAVYWSFSDAIVLFQIGTVVILGVYRTATGAMTLGTLIVFITYVNMLLWPVRQLGRILTDTGKTMVSVGRVQEVLDEAEESQDPDSIKPPLDGDIVFKNVSFAYEKSHPVLKDISFKVKKGQTVAILGPTGSGKSTMMHLLQRLYDYDKGSITINGYELKKIDKKWLRKNVGIVLQEPFLFSRTIKENIGIAKKDISDDDIYEASRIAAVHDVIDEFENGYDTMVGERGVTLSGGQKQRIAMARTLVNRSSILIFDDSLSAVDTETDATIRRELNKNNKNITTFIISHRVTTLSEADIILVIDDGRLVQQGTHEELISQEEGLYKRIWSIQSTLEEELEGDKRNAKVVI